MTNTSASTTQTHTHTVYNVWMEIRVVQDTKHSTIQNAKKNKHLVRSCRLGSKYVFVFIRTAKQAVAQVRHWLALANFLRNCSGNSGSGSTTRRPKNSKHERQNYSIHVWSIVLSITNNICTRHTAHTECTCCAAKHCANT